MFESSNLSRDDLSREIGHTLEGVCLFCCVSKCNLQGESSRICVCVCVACSSESGRALDPK